MLRNELKFSYTGEVLAGACEEQAAYHQARIEFWAAEQGKAEQLLREAGVEFREHQVTGGKRLAAVIDPDRQRRLDECYSALDRHRRELGDFERWQRSFATNKASNFELDPDDVAYFGL